MKKPVTVKVDKRKDELFTRFYERVTPGMTGAEVVEIPVALERKLRRAQEKFLSVLDEVDAFLGVTDDD